MRIGVNCFMLQPQMGGIAHYTLNLLRELLEGGYGHEYTLFWFPHNAAMLERLGSTRWRERAQRLDDQMQVLGCLGGIDLYFCPLGVLFPRPVPRPSVVTLADIQERFHPEFFAPADLYTRDLHFPASTRSADRVITYSQFSKDTLVRHHGLAPAKVVVAHTSVDRRFFEAERIARAPEAPLPPAFAYYPANLWKHKNHETLLLALKSLAHERGLDVQLVLTGFLDESAGAYPVRERAAALGIADRVHHLGFVGVEQVAYLYRRARLLVFPSLFEGFGMPLVEAMAAGCAVVAADATSIPEVTGDAALLFDPRSPQALADAIARVWCDDGLRDTLVTRGRARAGAFGPAPVVEAHLRAFAEAREAYSPLRHAWQRSVYEPYHRWRVERRWRHRLGER